MIWLMKPRDLRIRFIHSCCCVSNSCSLPFRTRKVTRSTIMSLLLTRAAGSGGRRRREVHVGADLEGVLEHRDTTNVEVQRHRAIAEFPEVLNELRYLEFGERLLQVDRPEPWQLDRQAGDDHVVPAVRLIVTQCEHGLEDLVERDAASPQA